MKRTRQDFFDQVYRIEVAAIAPGDTIVIYPRKGITEGDMLLLRKQAEEIWPDNKVIFTSGISRLEILRPSEVPEEP